MTVLQRSSTAAVASSRALPCSRAPRSNSMPAASETIQKRNNAPQKKHKKTKKMQVKILTRNSLGNSHELAYHLSFTRSRSSGKLLLAVRGLLLQALLRLGRSG